MQRFMSAGIVVSIEQGPERGITMIVSCSVVESGEVMVVVGVPELMAEVRREARSA